LSKGEVTFSVPAEEVSAFNLANPYQLVVFVQVAVVLLGIIGCVLHFNAEKGFD
jgi:hypothetical protein